MGQILTYPGWTTRKITNIVFCWLRSWNRYHKTHTPVLFYILFCSHCTSALFPPQLFVELNELIVKDHEMRWKERARWIKFEEDVEEETGRWGKAHVASLSFRSLLELRRTITHGKQLLHAQIKTHEDKHFLLGYVWYEQPIPSCS